MVFYSNYTNTPHPDLDLIYNLEGIHDARNDEKMHSFKLLGMYLDEHLTVSVPDHDGGRPMEVNACILITHMVYL